MKLSGYSFMLVEVLADQLHFQVISDQFKTIDSGAIQHTARRLQ